jgi:hypothetical protein
MRRMLERIRKREKSQPLGQPAEQRAIALKTLPIEYLELLTAREILGEVLMITPSDVDEMISQRLIGEELLLQQ